MAVKLPINPIMCRLLEAAARLECLEAMTVIVAACQLQHSIFLRPSDVTDASDRMGRAQFAHPLSDHITNLNAAYAYKHVQKEGKIGLEQWCHDNFLSKPMLDSLWRMQDRLKGRVEKRWPGGMNKGIKDIQNPMFSETIRKALAIGLVTQPAMLRSKSNSHITVNYNQPGLISPQSAVLYQGQDVSSATFTKRGAVFPAYRWIVYDKFESSNGKVYLQHRHCRT